MMTQTSIHNPDPLKKSRRSSFLLLALIGVVGLILLAVFYYGILHPPSQRVESGLAPDFTVTTYDGDAFRLSEHRGKPIVLNFWASWCETCKDEQPILESAWQRHQNEILFFGLSHLDQDNNARKWLERYHVTYPNALDLGGKVYNAYHVQGVPETFFIDANGNVVSFYVGAIFNEAELESRIQQLLNASKSPQE